MPSSIAESIDYGLEGGRAPGHLVPRRYTLDAFAREPGCMEGVAIPSLEAGTVLVVHTRYSRYRLFVLNGAQQRALVTGGSLFPESTEVRIEGATAGGSALKMGWIGVGLRLELSMGAQRITTSRVRSITIEPPGAVTAPGPASERPF